MRQLKITKSITNRESEALDKYLQEIGKEEMISVEEEVELAQRIRKGDREALEKLTRANLRFVVDSICKNNAFPKYNKQIRKDFANLFVIKRQGVRELSLR